MFWNFCEDGKSYLDEKRKEEHIDTVVICGLWTEECILATSYAASSRGYDVVVVGDAVGTATAHGEKALTIISGTCGKVVTTHTTSRRLYEK
jgi:nicotinamidase-related amidase